MFEFFWNLASFIVALGLLVTVHEYGHFWVARRCNVKVERFSVGFGKTLFKTYDKHGTEFVIALIPLGGYVKMLDERVDEVAKEDLPYAFNRKSVLQRIAIVSAGPLANFIFAIFAFYCLLLIGKTDIKPVIGNIQPASIASQTAMNSGQEIVAVNGEKTETWQQIQMALLGSIGEEQVTISTRDENSSLVNKFELDTSGLKYEPSKISAMETLGIEPYRPKVLTQIAVVTENGAAAQAGLLPGDHIQSIDGIDVKDQWQSLVNEVERRPGETAQLTILRDGQLQQITITPGTKETDDGRKLGFIGVSPRGEPWPEKYVINIQYGPLEAIGMAIDETWKLISLSFKTIGNLITGEVSVSNLSGPIGIAQGAGAHASIGIAYFLGFLALISVNLGIINLLPLPILDGGHLLYYVIELFSGKPVPEKVQEIGFKFGALVLLMLMSVALFNDFARLGQ
ncbi:sigma E protease regulator RseP [Thalassotalea sp. PS06]|uniref:sigma E protease regulator RseP n=1 Tax=Thalassotalea sp. PS06 TaxID=2594005 RepID=UPI001165636C|nr:sigma E protease regulator RseP [Thalassotalea sp. PS06]QDP01731.1 sigma E protease regulator RseP [Thalassotalea sp. PS06]